MGRGSNTDRMHEAQRLLTSDLITDEYRRRLTAAVAAGPVALRALAPLGALGISPDRIRAFQPVCG